MLEGKVRETIERHHMVTRGEKVLVAVSGGVDSVCLLEVLSRLDRALGIRLVVAHLDHGLRGKESQEDARFVAELAGAREFPVVVERTDVRAYAEEHKVGLEEAGRSVRREFLERTANDVGATRIALGHTRDDRAETMLFHLARGTGGAGLVGIHPVRLPYVRPLIDVSRAEVVAFAQTGRLSWREDRSNHDLRFSRNRIRWEVIPALERVNPRATEALARAAELLAEEQAALESLLDVPWLDLCRSEGAGRVDLRRRALGRLPPALQALLLRRAAMRATGTLRGVTRNHVDALRELASSEAAHGEISLPGLVARVEQGELSIEKAPCFGPRGYCLPLDLGTTELRGLGLSLGLTLTDWDGQLPARGQGGPSRELADADQISFPLHVRSRRPGDRFAPLGLGGTKRLSDFLLDERVPFYRRDSLPLVCDEERIVWVVGVRLSDAVRLRDTTRRILVLEARETA